MIGNIRAIGNSRRTMGWMEITITSPAMNTSEPKIENQVGVL